MSHSHSHPYPSSHFDPDFVPANSSLPLNNPYNPAVQTPHCPPTAPATYQPSASNEYIGGAPNAYDPNSASAHAYPPGITPNYHSNDPQAYGPGVTQLYSAGVTQLTYDPTQAQPQSTYDPNQAQPAYTPNQAQSTYDPTQAQSTYDPNQAQPTYAPNQAQPTYDPTQAQQYANNPGTNTAPIDPEALKEDDIEMLSAKATTDAGDAGDTASDKGSTKSSGSLEILRNISENIHDQGEQNRLIADKANKQAERLAGLQRQDTKDLKDVMVDMKETLTETLQSNSKLLHTMSERLVRVENDSSTLIDESRKTRQAVERLVNESSVPSKAVLQKIVEAVAVGVADALGNLKAKAYRSKRFPTRAITADDAAGNSSENADKKGDSAQEGDGDSDDGSSTEEED